MDKTLALPAPSVVLTALLLAWYAVHKRDLPWRVVPPLQPDPYRVWLSEVMLQQTTVVTVKPYYEKFLRLFPDVFALAAADQKQVMSAWAGLGYYARARNLQACAQSVVAEYHGIFPKTAAQLRTLRGIGAYTSAAIAAICFGEPIAAVDGNVERVMARLTALEIPLPQAKPIITALAQSLMPQNQAQNSNLAGDMVQVMMELGATVCVPKNPRCDACPWQNFCAAAALGAAQTFPKKQAKVAKPHKYGAAYVMRRQADGAVLLHTRPQSGLLAGMSAPLNTVWDTAKSPDSLVVFDQENLNQDCFSVPFLALRWQENTQKIRHIFTHFSLEVQVFTLILSDETLGTLQKKSMEQTLQQAGFRWVLPVEIKNEPLPTVFKKILEVAGGNK
jgi:A/G-specific adenine glycosylase